MLDGGSLAPHNSQHVPTYSLVVFHHKRYRHGCFGRPCVEGSALSAFNPLAAQRCVLCKQVLFVSLSGSCGSDSSIYIKGLPAMLEGMGRLVCLTGCIKQYHKAPNQPVISKLMYHFYLQHTPCKCFDPCNVEHLLSLLESLAPVPSLTTLKLVWKTATLLALVPAKHCSDLTLLCIDNQHLFFSIMLLFSFPYLVASQIDWVIFLLRLTLSLIPMLIFAMFFFI